MAEEFITQKDLEILMNNKTLIVIRTYPKHKSVSDYYNYNNKKLQKLDVIKLCLDEIANQYDQKLFDISLIANGYENLDLLKKYPFNIIEVEPGDLKSQYYAFLEIKNNINNYSSFFITEDDYLFDKNYLLNVKKICDNSNIVISPAGDKSIDSHKFFEKNDLFYMKTAYVNFAGSKEIFIKIVDKCLELTSSFNDRFMPLEGYLQDNYWAQNIDEINYKISLCSLKNFHNKHFVPTFYE